MPIDSSIPFRAFATVPLMSVQEHQQNALARQMSQAQIQSAEETMRDRMTQRGQQNALARAMQSARSPDGAIDYSKLSAAQGLDPAMSLDFNDRAVKQAATQKSAAAEAEKAKLQKARDHLEIVGQVMGGASNQQTYTQSLAQLQSAGIDISQMPTQFDPAYVRSNLTKAMDAKAQLDQYWKQKGDDLDQQKFAYQQQNDASGRAVQIRGQNITAAGQNKPVYDPNIGAWVARDGSTTPARMLNQAGAPANPGQPGQPAPRPTQKAPSGYRWNAAGTLEPIPGGPASAGKAPTEFQAKARIFSARADQADKIISSLGDGYSSAGINVKNAVGPAGVAVNPFLSAKSQKAEQAQRDFINAVLRLESGAAIGASEFDNARKQYFPQPGDSTDVIQQKADNRRLAVTELKKAGGEAQPANTSGTPSVNDLLKKYGN